MVAILASINGKLHLKLHNMLCALSHSYEKVLENYYTCTYAPPEAKHLKLKNYNFGMPKSS